ncbi:hypothetical protein B0H13DRAFT_1853462 [Mycena leptocephala]|nr:hypothetical protein B0H13DRAFT_1853462 [Mycena leptocephala]
MDKDTPASALAKCLFYFDTIEDYLQVDGIGGCKGRWGRTARDRSILGTCVLLVPRWAFRPEPVDVTASAPKKKPETKTDAENRKKLPKPMEEFVNAAAVTPISSHAFHHPTVTMHGSKPLHQTSFFPFLLSLVDDAWTPFPRPTLIAQLALVLPILTPYSRRELRGSIQIKNRGSATASRLPPVSVTSPGSPAMSSIPSRVAAAAASHPSCRLLPPACGRRELRGSAAPGRVRLLRTGFFRESFMSLTAVPQHCWSPADRAADAYLLTRDPHWPIHLRDLGDFLLPVVPRIYLVILSHISPLNSYIFS